MIVGLLSGLLIVAIFVQGNISTIPVVISVLLLMYILYKSAWIFFAAFISGIIIDSATLSQMGVTSMYLVLFVFSIYLYERKFEIQTRQFTILSSFVGGSIYSIVTSGDAFLLHGLWCSIITLALFETLNYFNTVKQHNTIQDL